MSIDLISARPQPRGLRPLFQSLSLSLSLFLPLSSLMIRPDQGRWAISLSLSLSDLYLSIVLRHNSQRSQYQTVAEDFNWGPGEFIRCSSSPLIPLTSLQSRQSVVGKSKAVVAVSEKGERDFVGSDEGDRDRRRRVTFAEKRIISLESQRERIKEGGGSTSLL